MIWKVDGWIVELTDGVHLSLAGHVLVAQKVASKIVGVITYHSHIGISVRHVYASFAGWQAFHHFGTFAVLSCADGHQDTDLCKSKIRRRHNGSYCYLQSLANFTVMKHQTRGIIDVLLLLNWCVEDILMMILLVQSDCDIERSQWHPEWSIHSIHRRKAEDCCKIVYFQWAACLRLSWELWLWIPWQGLRRWIFARSAVSETFYIHTVSICYVLKNWTFCFIIFTEICMRLVGIKIWLLYMVSQREKVLFSCFSCLPDIDKSPLMTRLNFKICCTRW